MAKYKTVDAYIEGHIEWEFQLKKLRKMLLDFPLKETIKWGAPVYMFEGKNLIGMAAFKNHFSLWFFEGTLLTKNKELLINAQEGKTKSLRQIKFDKNSELEVDVLSEYIKESIEMTASGVKIKPEPKKALEIPVELFDKLTENKNLKEAFLNLSPGKQQEYCLYISEAKRGNTKEKRLEKIIPLIKFGKGLNDSYK